MGEISFDKQSELINAESMSKLKLKIFGVGSIGSILTKMAALTGIKDITCYDFDKVEPDNIGSQEFDLTHIGMPKTEAIQKLMKERFNFDVAVHEGKITKETEIYPEDNTVYFCAFDSLEARKILWDKLKNFPIIWGESRIGFTSQRYYFVNLKDRDEEWIKSYEESLDPNGPRTELKCGEKGCFPSNAELVSKIMRQLTNIGESKNLATQYIGDWGMPASIFIAPEDEMPGEIKYD